nr:Eco29kI family restriction endonuclease [Sinorhizobium medicae]
MSGSPYNPLEEANLAKSIEFELLRRSPVPLSAAGDVNASIYVIYYVEDFPAYAPIGKGNLDDVFSLPIYIGKAIPKGGHEGGLSSDASKGRSLADRLAQHATSIEHSSNLRVEDFFVRSLVVDDIWIPLGENILIETFKPLWNNSDRRLRKQGSWEATRDAVPLAMVCPASSLRLCGETGREPFDRSVLATASLRLLIRQGARKASQGN